MPATKKKKKMAVIFITVAVILAGMGIAAYVISMANAGPAFPIVRAVPLEVQDLKNTVGVNGTVESTNVKKVYSRLSYPVKEIMVETGDRVLEGDTLCVLDSENLESAILKQSAALTKQQNNAGQQLTDARRNLQSAQESLENAQNIELLSAETSVRNAEAGLRAAEAAVRNTEASVQTAALNVLDARNTYSQIKDDSALADEVVAEYRRAMNRQEIDFENKKAMLEDTKRDLEDSKKALEDARIRLEAARNSVNQQLENYQSAVRSAQNAADLTGEAISLEDLRADLERCTVKAPASGVVTAVFVTEGAVANGLMFVIEDTESLRIKTRVKEYEIASVKVGNAVEIKSDATGNELYNGKLIKIAPTSVKNAAGDIDTIGDVEFEAEIAVTSLRTALKIGMKTRMNIIYEEKKRIFAVPYEALATDESGNPVVYAVRAEGEAEENFARAVGVTTGMENDFFIEVSSDGLAEGDLIIVDVEGIYDGARVTAISDAY